MSTFTLYVHITPANKLYIGITSQTVNERWENGKGYSGSPHFYSAIQKYGWDNIKHIVLLENLSKEVACECEKYLIAKYKTTNREYGYNISLGGDVTQLGLKRTPEQIKRLSDAHKELPVNEFAIQRMAETNRGRKRPPEVIEKMRKAKTEWHKRPESKEIMRNINKGKTFSDEHKRKLSESHKGNVSGMKGKRHTEESRKKMSESQKKAVKVYSEDGLKRISEASKNRIVTDETREKLRQSRLGKKASEETRLKQSLAKKGKPSPKKGKKLSEETKKKISESVKKSQKPLTDEQRKKISEASKRRWARYREEMSIDGSTRVKEVNKREQHT